MNGHELLERLKSLTKKQLDEEVRLLDKDKPDEENIWLYEVEISVKGESGYEVGGEIRLIGSE